MTAYDGLALISGAHEQPCHPGVLHMVSDGMTAMLAPRPRRAILLPQTRRRALQGAAARQIMLEAAMPLGTVLPFRPGLQLTPDDIDPLLRANRDLLDGLFKRFAGSVQYQVTVRWSAQDVLTKFRSTAELAPIFAKGHASPVALENAVKQLAQRLSNEMQAKLDDAVVDSLCLPVTENILLNMVVQVAENDMGRFDRAIEAIDAVWTEGLQIKQIGPAPAASFAMLETQAVTATMVQNAFERLRLDANVVAKADLMAARKRALIDASHDANAINRAAQIAAASLSADQVHFHLCSVISEDQAATVPGATKMAVSA